MELGKELNKAGFATASFAHEHHWYITREPQVNSHHFQAIVQCELVALIQIHGQHFLDFYSHHIAQAYDFLISIKRVKAVEKPQTLFEQLDE
jgi:hypothetical protein